MSAVLAVVMSITLSTQNGASADGDTNADEVKNAVSALETAVADPDAELTTLGTAGTQIGSVQYDIEPAPNVTGFVSIAPTVTVLANSDTTGTNQSVINALSSGYLGTWTGDLTTARTSESNELTSDSEGVPAQINTITTATSVTLADGSTTATPVANNTLKADLATIQTELLTTTRTPSAIHADIKAKVYTAFGLEYVDGQEKLSTNDPVYGALNNLYTPDDPLTTGTDESAGTDLVQLATARANEKKALAGIKAILVEVNKAIVTATDSAKVTINSTSIADSRFSYEGASDIVDRDEAKAEVAKAEGLLTSLLAELATIDGNELTAFDELEALVTTLTTIGGAPSGVLRDRLEAIDTALLKNNVDDLDDDEDPPSTNYAPDVIVALKTAATNHIVKALEALSDLDGTDAQKKAIQDLLALLTLVDNAVVAATFTDSGNTPDTVNDLTNEAKAVADTVAALKAVKAKLETLYVVTSDVDTAIVGLNTIWNTDVSGGG